MSKWIELSAGKRTRVDDSDYEWLSHWKWSYLPGGYAVRRDPTITPIKLVYMHRAIIGAKDGEIVDHANGQKLDNRRSNLRLATRSNNASNQKKRSSTKAKYKGVIWRQNAQRWQGYIGTMGKWIHLGYFDSEIEAAKAYDEAARQMFGEFAKTNF